MDYLTPLISTLVGVYVPFPGDMTTKIACSMAITQLILRCLNFISTKFLPLLGIIFKRDDNYIIVSKRESFYKDIIRYLYDEYKSKIKGGYLGNETIQVKEFQRGKIIEEYEGNRIVISFEEHADIQNGKQSLLPYQPRSIGSGNAVEDSSVMIDSELNNIKFSSRADVSVIKEYITDLLKKIGSKT